MLLQDQSIKQQRVKDHDKTICSRHCIFLLKKRDVVIHCARIIMNFITLIQYTFHDENMLNYIKHALYRIDNLKIVFAKYRFQNIARDKNDENETHFYIFKLHVMIYYVTFIRLYDSAQSFDIVYEKRLINFC